MRMCGIVKDNSFSIFANMITKSISAVLMAVDRNDKIIKLQYSKYSSRQKDFKNKNIKKVIELLSSAENYNIFNEGYEYCKETGETLEIKKITHQNQFGLKFYYKIIMMKHQDEVLILFHDVTENVLIEEEFLGVAEQYEKVNRELNESMTKLDFHLMDIDKTQKKIAALYKITSIVQKTVNQQEVLKEIVEGISREFGYNHIGIFLMDNATNELELRASVGYSEEDLRIPLGKGLIGTAALNHEAVYVEDVNQDERYIKFNETAEKKIAVPLIVNDKVLGVLNVDFSKGRVIQEYDLDLLKSLASQIAVTIAHAKYVVKVENQAMIDEMTGLYNYRSFVNLLKREYGRAIRYGRPLSVLMIDIDNFKHYNDTNGHLMGDFVLKNVAALIKAQCREIDCVCRYGGEEFVVILPEAGEKASYIVAERIRKSVEKYKFFNCDKQPRGFVSVSIGVAVYNEQINSEMEIVYNADLALYKAKVERNTTIVFNNDMKDDFDSVIIEEHLM